MTRRHHNTNTAPLTVKDADRNRYGLDAQQEKYAQLRAQGMPPEDCIKAAHLKIKNHKLFEHNNPAIVARITMLQDEATVQVIEKIKIDKEVLVRETWDMYQHCKALVTKVDKFENEETAPVRAGEAIKSLELLAKLEGLLVQKTEVRVGPLDSLSDDELTRIATELAAQVGLDAGTLRIEESKG